MTLEEFQKQERDRKNAENVIVDPNVEAMLNKESSNNSVVEDSRVNSRVTPGNIVGVQKEEPMDKAPEDNTANILDRLDAAVERKKTQHDLLDQAREESAMAGEQLTKEEFMDILDQNKDIINGVSEEEIKEADFRINPNPSEQDIHDLQQHLSFQEELAAEAAKLEEDDMEPTDIMMMTEEEYEEQDKVTPFPQHPQEHREILQATSSRNDQMSYEEATKIFESMEDEYYGEGIDYDQELKALDSNTDISKEEELIRKRNKKLASLIKEKVKPVTQAFDISTFSISKKPAAAQIKVPKSDKNDIADWVLMSSRRPIYMRKFSGSEIERLANGGKGRTRLNKALDTWSLIYNHIIDPHKPDTVEKWAKCTSFLDIDHIYMAIYRANFGGQNYIPYTCDACNEVFLTDDMDIMEMCKFESAEARTIFDSIIGTEQNEMSGLYSTEVIPVSDDYAFVFREPSIYNIIFESAILDEDFVDKFGDMVSFCSYIDSIYYINKEERILQPVKTNIYQNKMQKTVQARIIRFSQIMSTLTSDQYNTILAYMQNINKGGESLTYQLPEVNCPKCKGIIKARPADAQQLVFTRHQLAALATS